MRPKIFLKPKITFVETIKNVLEIKYLKRPYLTALHNTAIVQEHTNNNNVSFLTQ